MVAQGFCVRTEVVARQKNRPHGRFERLHGIAQGHSVDAG
jgi:hypothetical protein